MHKLWNGFKHLSCDNTSPVGNLQLFHKDLNNKEWWPDILSQAQLQIPSEESSNVSYLRVPHINIQY